MAFMGRGRMPSIGDDNNSGMNDMRTHDYYRGYGYYNRFHYYIPMDNTYVIMQMIVTFIILIVGIITYLATYESSIVDPIENIKKMFINTHLIIIGILLAITIIINFFSKNKEALIKKLIIIIVISIMTMLVFFVIKLHLDTTYNKEKFEQFYTEQNITESSNAKTKIDIGITGASLKTEKEYYIDECMKLYNIFKAKTYGTLGLHVLLNILIIYQILRISKIQGRKEQMNKDDLILFDEEENIKF